MKRPIVVQDIAFVPPLTAGAHADFNQGLCTMEAVAYFAGEAWSDSPTCACPVIGAFLRSWNDALPDDERDALLRPVILRMIGTRSDVDLQRQRSRMAADWLVQVNLPAWLRLADLADHAEVIAETKLVPAIAKAHKVAKSVKRTRGTAAGAAAASRAAGRSATRAAWAAATLRDDDAGSVCWATLATPWEATVDAAWACALAASLASGRVADAASIDETCRALQRSAVALVDRMILGDPPADDAAVRTSIGRTSVLGL